jgi:flagellar basal body-associated protein FliL
VFGFTAPHNRTTLYIIIGVLLALLFAVGAIAAYYVGKSNAGKAVRPLPWASQNRGRVMRKEARKSPRDRAR